MSLKERLYDREQSPPQRVWDKIIIDLDDSHLDKSFPVTLREAEVAAPPAAWENISKNLAFTDKPVIPLQRPRNTLFRYAAAIAAMIVLGVAIAFFYRNGKSGPSDGIAVSSDTASPGHSDLAVDHAQKTSTGITGGNDGAQTESPSTTTIARTEKARKKSVYRSSDVTDESDLIYAYNDNSSKIADRYVMLMTPNGIIRMSKKLGDIICCVAGEEQNEDCRDQVRKWQEKLAASPVAPAPGNFMDILSLVSALNEDDL